MTAYGTRGGGRRRKLDWGRVIFIASESGFNIPVEMIHYGVGKTADIAAARGLAIPPCA